MTYSVYDLKQFYARREGRLVRRLVTSHVRDFWPNLAALTVMGAGYAVPYLRALQEDAGRTFAVMPPAQGVHLWPEDGGNRVCLSGLTELPFATESIDRILLVHGLEFAENPGAMFHEFWRVLKSNGRLLMVVPNRLGLWARADRTPFGHGTPYSMSQLNDYLHDNMFVIERRDRALFMPPFRSFWVLRGAYTVESFGRYIFPGLAGLHMIEASKQIYAALPRGKAERVRGRRILVGHPVPAA